MLVNPAGASMNAVRSIGVTTEEDWRRAISRDTRTCLIMERSLTL